MGCGLGGVLASRDYVRALQVKQNGDEEGSGVKRRFAIVGAHVD